MMSSSSIGGTALFPDIWKKTLGGKIRWMIRNRFGRDTFGRAVTYDYYRPMLGLGIGPFLRCQIVRFRKRRLWMIQFLLMSKNAVKNISKIIMIKKVIADLRKF